MSWKMRCCAGLPQQVWHHTSVLPRSPLTVLLKIFTSSGISRSAEWLAARRHHVDLRFLQLDDRAAGIGERVELLVDCLAERPDPLDWVLVVVVVHRGRQQL